FALVPLMIVFTMSRPKQAFKHAYLAAITANLISLYWIGLNSGAGYIPVLASLFAAVLYLALFWGILGMIWTWIHRRTGMGFFLFPFLWVTMEWLRSFGPLGFPWINLALTQSGYLPFLQIAEVTGTYGITFWVVLLNTGFYYLASLKNNRKPIVLSIISLIAVMGIIGWLRQASVERSSKPEFSVAIIQPNINPNEKWDRENRTEVFDIMHTMLDSALELQPDLVLWPESALPTMLRLSSSARIPIQEKLSKYNISLLSGTVDRLKNENGEYDYYNGTILIDSSGWREIYYKLHLVPFGEYIPLSGYFPILKKLNIGQANFVQGKENTVFHVDSVLFSNVICYESSIPGVVRGFFNAGAEFLTIQSNDGWLGRSSGPYQHFENAKLRAIENRIGIARAANTGVSGTILPSGRVVDQLGINEKGIIMAQLPLLIGKTFYTRFGDIFAIICTFISLLIWIIAWKNK
ncbi:MAG: apolipoprotein N-acyltransferase, partial [Candidatus Neomarinimicrobiota bacterium]